MAETEEQLLNVFKHYHKVNTTSHLVNNINSYSRDTTQSCILKIEQLATYGPNCIYGTIKLELTLPYTAEV